MTSITEREEFGKRLRQIMRRSGYNVHSPTALAREFNARFDGKLITVHAARKWLHGEAIPTQEKLRVLARWLDVTAEWLRFGSEDSRNAAPHGASAREDTPSFDLENIKLLAELQRLDQPQRVIAREIVRLLVRFNFGSAGSNRVKLDPAIVSK